MNTAVQADPVGFFLQCEDSCQMTVAAAEKNLIEKAEYRAEDTHHMDSLLPFAKLSDRKKNQVPKAEKPQVLDVLWEKKLPGSINC